MKNHSLILALATLICLSWSQQTGAQGKPMAVGARMDLGIASGFGSAWDADTQEGLDKSGRFAPGFGVYTDIYLNKILALNMGMDILGKGLRLSGTASTDAGSADVEGKFKFTYLDIPVGVKLDLHNFQVGVGMIFAFALAGKTEATMTINGATETMEEDFTDDDWATYRRFNIGPKVTLGYAIPIGRISLIPGAAWSMHLLNETVDAETEELTARSMNLMFTLGVASR